MTVDARQALRLTLTGVMVALPAAGIVARRAPQAAPQTVRPSSDRVVVDAVVTDEHGQPVAGLTKADFSVVENGQPQQISEFRAVVLPTSGKQRGTAWSFGPPGSVTNQHAPLSRLFAVLIDDTSLSAGRAGAVRSLLSTLIDSTSPDDRIAVFYASRPDLAVGPTGDKSVLRDAAGRVGTALPATEPTAQPAPAGQPADPSAPAPPVVRALADLADSLQTSTFARRAILLVSGGTDYAAAVQLNRQGQWEPFGRLRTALETARQAGVPVYAIDPRGAPAAPNETPPDPGPAPAPDTGPTNALPPGGQQNDAAPRLAYEWAFLRTIALETGGFSALGVNNLPASIRRVIADNSTFYVLSYKPATLAHDGRVHDISIRVDRPELRVRAPAAYVAPAASLTGDDAQRMVRRALAGPLPSTGVALRAVLPAVRSDTSVATLALDVIYPPPAGGSARVEDTVTIIIMAVDASGQLLTTSTLDATVSTAAGSGNTAVTIRNAVALPIRAQLLKVGVASRTLGRVGTVNVPIVRK